MADKLQEKVFQAITTAEGVGAGNHVSVTIKKSGFLGMGTKTIEISGRATSESVIAKIEEAARANSQGLEVVSSIRLGRSG